MTYIQGVSPVHIVLGLYTDGEVSAVAAYTDETEALNIRDRLRDSLTPGYGVIDYTITKCVVKEKK